MNGESTMTRKAVEQHAFKEIVMQAFTLHTAFRKVFFLCEVRGLTIAEAAAVLSISPAAVKLRLERAHREIEAKLQVASQRTTQAFHSSERPV